MTARQPVSSAEAWLTWFDTYKAAQTRTYLCRTYAVDGFMADTLINTARFRVWVKWPSITAPLAFFRQTLRREAWRCLAARQREQRKLADHATMARRRAHMAERTARHVDTLLGHVQSHRQQQLLTWFIVGYDDAQVAATLGTTPAAVRVARHTAYQSLRQKVRPSKSPAPRAALVSLPHAMASEDARPGVLPESS